MNGLTIAALAMSLASLALSGMSIHYTRQARARQIERARLLRLRDNRLVVSS